MSDDDGETSCYYEESDEESYYYYGYGHTYIEEILLEPEEDEEYVSDSETSPNNVYDDPDATVIIKDIIKIISEHGINSKVEDIIKDVEYFRDKPKYLKKILDKLELLYDEVGYLTKNDNYQDKLKDLVQIKRRIFTIQKKTPTKRKMKKNGGSLTTPKTTFN